MDRSRDVAGSPVDVLRTFGALMVAEALDRSECTTSTGCVELCQAASKGDPKAQQALIRRLFDRVRRTSTYMLGLEAETEDVAQTALVEILRAAGHFRGESTLEFWADRITVRLAIKHKKKFRRRSKLFFQFFGHPDLFEREAGELPTLTLRQRMAVHLQKIPIEKRTALILHHVYGYTVPEISEMTGIKVATVRDRLVSSKKQMQKLLLEDPSLVYWLADKEGGQR